MRERNKKWRSSKIWPNLNIFLSFLPFSCLWILIWFSSLLDLFCFFLFVRTVFRLAYGECVPLKSTCNAIDKSRFYQEFAADALASLELDLDRILGINTITATPPTNEIFWGIRLEPPGRFELFLIPFSPSMPWKFLRIEVKIYIHTIEVTKVHLSGATIAKIPSELRYIRP